MRFVFFNCFIILLQFNVIAQNPFNGLYINNTNEFICFDNDTIWFRINNHDAFGTFTIGKGNFKMDKKGRFCLLKSNLIISQTSTLKKYPRNDKKLIITVLDKDSVPMEFVNIKMTKLQDKSSHIICSSDKNGQLRLSTKQINFLNDMNVSICIETIGFATEKILLLKCGYDYVIQSVVPDKFPFTINKNKKIKIDIVNSNNIEVKIENRLKSTLYKNIDNYSCSECLFQDIK
ncbi:MAG: hypothetical protein PHE76_02765 [Candidatus Pacebacteria bacterium]|nr:hypothetical protein [Candidatus Paceibacterota bacterium]